MRCVLIYSVRRNCTLQSEVLMKEISCFYKHSLIFESFNSTLADVFYVYICCSKCDRVLKIETSRMPSIIDPFGDALAFIFEKARCRSDGTGSDAVIAGWQRRALMSLMCGFKISSARRCHFHRGWLVN